MEGGGGWAGCVEDWRGWVDRPAVSREEAREEKGKEGFRIDSYHKTMYKRYSQWT